MPLHRFRRQYDQLSQFKRRRIVGMMEACEGPLGPHFENENKRLVIKFRIGLSQAEWSARRVARQLSRSDCVPTASSATIQAHVAPSLGAPVSSRTIRRYLAERYLRSQRPFRVLPLTPTHRRLHLEWCRARGNWTAAGWNQVVFSDESRFNLSSDDNRVHVWRPGGERLNPAFALQ
ncbi:transposable element Tcb2 transposase [Trichonephila clavipes]|nr:transposable element Tcb2 transposase [Trichonephila clavipes]